MQPAATLAAEMPIPILGARKRLEAVDLLRGLLMILMALDHTRDYFSSATVDPTDPLQSWPALFLTRWVTHLCAPGFVALTGTSVYLQRQRGKSAGQASRLLFTRGLWFLGLDLTLISFAWSFTLRYPYMNIISTIGICMVVMSALQRLSVRAIGFIGVLIVLLHNLLDPIQAAKLNRFSNLWILLHQRGFLAHNGHAVAMVYFPVLAWFGIMCLGYAFGPVLSLLFAARRTLILRLSGIFLLLFTALRALRAYGDPFRFQHLPTASQTLMSFFELQKYPPSLQYILATFSFLLLLYLLFDTAAEHNWLPPVRRQLEVYGRVPFLFYLLHILLIHTAALVATFAVHGDWRFWIGPGSTWGDASPANWGYALPVVYAIWIAVVVALYPACRWFSLLKARRRDWWLSYL